MSDDAPPSTNPAGDELGRLTMERMGQLCGLADMLMTFSASEARMILQVLKIAADHGDEMATRVLPGLERVFAALVVGRDVFLDHLRQAPNTVPDAPLGAWMAALLRGTQGDPGQ